MSKRYLLVLFFLTPLLYAQNFPENPDSLSQPVSQQRYYSFIAELQNDNAFAVTEGGRSAGNHPLYLIHFLGSKKQDAIRVLFFAQQHGNEPAGKDAILYLIRKIRDGSFHIPQSIDLWLIPQMNPDGAYLYKRTNHLDKDLNRDHLLLSQPETQFLHRIVQKIRPHVAVDCHEFSRDSRAYTKKGWLKWPIITMGAANNPIFSTEVRKLGLSWCNEITGPMAEAGINYTRYSVGGAPPDDEQRYSTPECDDARNGIGAYGGLSFIIESGLMRRAENQSRDLGSRIRAYLALFKQIFIRADRDQNLLRSIQKNQARLSDPFIPTNYFWANPGSITSQVKVLDAKSNKSLTISTANFMHELVTKKSVTKPESYIIAAEAETLFVPLLQKHALSYYQLEKEDSITVEPCHLIQVETFHDSVYQRYAGRQIVFSEPSVKKYFNRGSIIVPVSQEFVRKVIILLEPNMMYGLYKHKEFSDLVDPSQIVPVYRLTNRERIK